MCSCDGLARMQCSQQAPILNALLFSLGVSADGPAGRVKDYSSDVGLCQANCCGRISLVKRRSFRAAGYSPGGVSRCG
jgi:hypothetical protein